MSGFSIQEEAAEEFTIIFMRALQGHHADATQSFSLTVIKSMDGGCSPMEATSPFILFHQ